MRRLIIALMATAAASWPAPCVAGQSDQSAQTVYRPEDAAAASLRAMNASEGEVRLRHAQDLAAALGRAQRNGTAAAQLRTEIQRASRSGVSAGQLSVARTALAVLLLGLGQLIEARETVGTAERQLGSERPGTMEHVAAMLVLGRALTAVGELKAAGLMLDLAAKRASAAKLPLLQAQIEEAQAGHALLRGDGVAAMALYSRAIDTLSRRLGDDDARLASPLTGLANAQQLAGDFERSEMSFVQAMRVAAAYEGRSNRPHAIRIEYARLLTATGRHDQALREATIAYRSIDVGTAAGRSLRGLAASARGFASLGLGRATEARALFEKGISLTIAERGANSPDLPPGFIELARLDLAGSRPQSVERYTLLAEAILARQAPDAPLMAEAMSLRAVALLALGRPEAALQTAREAAAILSRRSQAFLGATTPSNAAVLEQVVRRGVYERLLDISFSVNGDGGMSGTDVFAAAQALHLGSTSMSIKQLAARHAAGSGPLAAMLVERRRVTEDWRAVEVQLDEQRSGDRADPAVVARLEAKRRRLTDQAGQLDERLKIQFPDFVTLVSPRPVDVELLKARLDPGEAFLMQVTTAQATHLWLVTRDAASPIYARTPFGAEEVGFLAQALRRSVTFQPDRLPAFDARAAYRMYKALLEPFAARLRSVDTLIVSIDRQAHALPLAMLVVTDPGEEKDPDRFDFLVRHRLATAWTPSPASFVALRFAAAPSPVLLPFLGVGAPVLIGEPGQQEAALARIFARRRAVVDPDDLRQLEPIRNAERQLHAMASNFNAGPTDMLVHEKATEAALKAHPLGKYRTLAFATHGIVAGQFSFLAEPGLVLTPPAIANETDDGLLTASEISKLSFNAELVILSACDTASSDGSFAGEGLSGLARAFFFAGARSLLVSGWAVKPGVAEELTTGLIRVRAADPSIGKAEALRRSMLATVEGPNWFHHHPAFWASFMIAGDPG